MRRALCMLYSFDVFMRYDVHILMADTKKINPGGIADRPDPRDFQWNSAEFGAALPPFDWNTGYDIEEELRTILNQPNFALKPNDQGNSLSCGGQAWSKYAAILYAVAAKIFTENSAKFIYAQTFVPGVGSMGRDNCDILIKQGCADEDLCESGSPATETFMNRPQDISANARLNAKFDQALSYANVALDIDQCAQAIKSNHGMVIGIRGAWDTDSWHTANPEPPVGASSTWGHWIYAGKAQKKDGKKQIGLLNSWGPGIGANGWQWISEDYFSDNGKYLMGGWTHILGASELSAGTLKHTFNTNLAYGDQSNEVKALQKALQIDLDLPLTVQNTGYYGPATRQAVLKFQRKYSVASVAEINSVQGNKCGPATRKKLNELFA